MFEATGLPVDNTRLAWHANALRQLATGSLADVHFAQQRLKALEDDPRRRHAQLMADAWCAAFMQPKTTDTAGDVVTTRVLRRIADADPERITAEEQEELFASATGAGRRARRRCATPSPSRPTATASSTGTWSSRTSSPSREDPAGPAPQGWEGGFTCIVGNPPWERVKLQEQEFFAERDPEIAGAKNAAARKKLIAALRTVQPAALDGVSSRSVAAEAESGFLRLSADTRCAAWGRQHVFGLRRDLPGLRRPEAGRA